MNQPTIHSKRGRPFANRTACLHVSTHLWMLRRAVQLARLLGEDWEETAVLQPPLFQGKD